MKLHIKNFNLKFYCEYNMINNWIFLKNKEDTIHWLFCDKILCSIKCYSDNNQVDGEILEYKY